MEPDSFHQSSYQSQVRRLRHLAETALKKYPVKVSSIEFIHHGENTTFKINAKDGDRYLLRIHRNDYHSHEALLEELKWLSLLAQQQNDFLTVPTPIHSKTGNFLEETQTTAIADGRKTSLLRWIDGAFIRKSLNEKHMVEVGKILAHLQKNRLSTQHRRYWTADGLVGKNPKFGSMDYLLGVSKRDQSQITAARKKVHAKLKAYEHCFPDRLGLIHADLHFGNFLKTKTGFGVIDFDDCGFGFHVFDLTPPLISAEFTLGKEAHKKLPRLKEALISGHSSMARWDEHDNKILSNLLTARKLEMVGWLNSRSDNPRLKSRLKLAVERVLNHLNSKS